MVERKKISLTPLTPEAFEPYGQIIGPRDVPPEFSGPHIESWSFSCEIEDDIKLMYARYSHQPMLVRLMERHTEVTQCFLPLGDAASVMVVARGEPAREAIAPPRPEDIRAFYVDGGRGILLWRGTWHALTRFPVDEAGAGFALITSAATQNELEVESRGGARPKLTQVADLGREFGTEIAVIESGRPESLEHSAPA